MRAIARSVARHPEFTILKACARASLAPLDVERIRLALNFVSDDSDLIKSAWRHGVGYFVASHLLESERANELVLAPPLRERLRELLRQTAVRAMLMLRQQQTLQTFLDDAGLRGVWLKGLPLSQQLYCRIEARQCRDLDLLTEPGQLQAVEHCLGSAGFERYRDPLPGKNEHFMSAHHSCWHAACTGGGQVMLELHHRLAGPGACQPGATDILRRARHVMIDKWRCLVPSREDELLLLCLHAHHHNFAILRCLMDVAEYVNRFNEHLNWDQFWLRSRESRSLGRVVGTLSLTAALLESNPAEERLVGQRLGPVQSQAIRRPSTVAWLEPDAEEDDFLRLRLGLLMDRWTDVIRLLGPHFFPPSAYVRAHYPSWWARLPGIARAYHIVLLTLQAAARFSRA